MEQKNIIKLQDNILENLQDLIIYEQMLFS